LEQCSAGFLGAGTVRRVFPRATATAARGPTRHRKQLETAGSGSASSPLPFPAGGDHHCHLQKEGKRKQSFGSSSPFRSALFSSPFQISFIVDLSFVYIFSFASGGRQLGSAAVCRGRR
jgi:hypothetical protein